jgi:hypothetical protein
MNQEIDKKATQDAWLHEHTLSSEQFKQLIQNKLNRALAMSTSVKQRESLAGPN